jgi:ATP-binding cassette subfamily B protein
MSDYAGYTGHWKFFRDRWVRFARRLPSIASSVRLVWEAAPRLTAGWAFLLLLQGLLPIGTVYLTRSFVNSLTGILRGPQGNVWPAMLTAVGLALFLLASEALSACSTWVRSVHAEAVRDHIMGLIHRKSARIRMEFYDAAEFYDRLYRARDEGWMRPSALVESIGAFVQGGITVGAMLFILAPYGVWLPATMLLATIPAVIAVLASARNLYEWRRLTTTESRRAIHYGSLLSAREAAAELRLYGLSPLFEKRFQTIQIALRKGNNRVAALGAVFEAGSGALSFVVMGLALLYLLARTINGGTQLGDLAFVFQAFQQGRGFTRTSLSQFGQIYSNTLFVGDLFEFLALEEEPLGAGESDQALDLSRSTIEFRDVTFSYPGADKPALAHFNLTIGPRQKVAIVGTNGAGKSTLIKLLCRFYDPDAGEILVDNRPVRELPVEALRRQVTVLFQEPVHYAETASENIGLGAWPSEPENAEITQAARDAGADGFLGRLSDGYATPLGRLFPGGVDLSSGEWQRVALARAYLRRAHIVVLDEPTSAMDPWSEAEWLDRFRVLAAQKTAIIITHRLTAARYAERIYLMVDGQVRESGSHAELIALGRLYSQAWTGSMGAAV